MNWISKTDPLSCKSSLMKRPHLLTHSLDLNLSYKLLPCLMKVDIQCHLSLKQLKVARLRQVIKKEKKSTIHPQAPMKALKIVKKVQAQVMRRVIASPLLSMNQSKSNPPQGYHLGRQ